MADQDGPRVTLQLRCTGCLHERSEYYAVQGDSGHKVDCAHPSLSEGPRRIGDTTWTTPSWCPLREKAITEAIKEVLNGR